MNLRLSGLDQRHLRTALKVLLSPDSAATEEEWHVKLLGVFLSLAKANSGAVRSGNGAQFRMTPVGLDKSIIGDYRDYYQRFDYGRALGDPQVHGQLFSRNNHYGERLPAFRKSEYYTDYLSKNRLLDAMCLSTRTDRHDRGSVLYFWYERDLSEMNRAKVVATLRLIAPAFRSGMALRTDLHKKDGRLKSALDKCADGCALFTHTGVLLHRNPSLSALLDTSPETGVIVEEIERQVKDVVRLFFSRNRLPGNFTRATADCRSGGQLFRISTCTLDVGHSGAEASIMATVSPLSGEVNDSSTHLRLQKFFGLTRREAEVALLLRSRMTNREIAVRLGMSEHTARHHTENILAKLGVSNRREIEARVATQ